jgi:hypothetical protein
MRNRYLFLAIISRVRWSISIIGLVLLTGCAWSKTDKALLTASWLATGAGNIEFNACEAYACPANTPWARQNKPCPAFSDGKQNN